MSFAVDLWRLLQLSGEASALDPSAKHRFVDEIAVELDDSTLYISMINKVAAPRC